MALPLPSVVADVGPGGPLVTSMRGINALQNDMLANKIKGIEAQYAPLTVPAEAASKLAYANLMGPQFLAKLMNNPDILAGMKNPQDAVNYLNAIARTQGNASNALLNNPLVSNQSPLSKIVNNVKNAFGFGNQQSQSPTNALIQPTQQNNPDRGYSYDQNGNNMVATPAEVNAVANRLPVQSNAQGGNFFTNVGQQLGKKEQEIELGKSRGQAINELGKQYAQDVEAMAPLNHLAQISQSPIFMNMRKDIPFFQHLQIQTLSKIGNPEQQRIIGDFITSTRNAIANTVNSFQGRAMAKEFDFANTMKVSDNDTIGVMLGKLESLMTFKKAAMQRNQIANQLMGAPNNMNEGDAYRKANEAVNMDKIRDNVANQLAMPIRIRNKRTNEIRFVTPKEYNEMLKKSK